MSPTDPDRIVYVFDIPAEQPWSRVLNKGQTLRIIDSEGEQAVDALMYVADDTAERYSAQDTLRVQGSAYLELGTRLISNRGRVMAKITADTCGRHDTSAGCCSCESNAVRFGEATRYLHACRENFILELSRYGLTKRDIVSNLNFFMNVPIDPNGNFTVLDGPSAGRQLRRRHCGDGRVVRDLELSAGQQSLQRFRSDTDPRGDQAGLCAMKAVNSARKLA